MPTIKVDDQGQRNDPHNAAILQRRSQPSSSSRYLCITRATPSAPGFVISTEPAWGTIITPASARSRVGATPLKSGLLLWFLFFLLWEFLLVSLTERGWMGGIRCPTLPFYHGSGFFFSLIKPLNHRRSEGTLVLFGIYIYAC